jgi:hypothetical protein
MMLTVLLVVIQQKRGEFVFVDNFLIQIKIYCIAFTIEHIMTSKFFSGPCRENNRIPEVESVVERHLIDYHLRLQLNVQVLILFL